MGAQSGVAGWGWGGGGTWGGGRNAEFQFRANDGQVLPPAVTDILAFNASRAHRLTVQCSSVSRGQYCAAELGDSAVRVWGTELDGLGTVKGKSTCSLRTTCFNLTKGITFDRKGHRGSPHNTNF